MVVYLWFFFCSVCSRNPKAPACGPVQRPPLHVGQNPSGSEGHGRSEAAARRESQAAAGQSESA